MCLARSHAPLVAQTSPWFHVPILVNSTALFCSLREPNRASWFISNFRLTDNARSNTNVRYSVNVLNNTHLCFCLLW